jgi:hypothetical protein
MSTTVYERFYSFRLNFQIEEKNFQNECLRTGNSELRAQLKRTEVLSRVIEAEMFVKLILNIVVALNKMH